MIIAIPISLLWNVRIKRRQKIFLGVFLSLSIFMTITASVRAPGVNYNGEFDLVWIFIWHHAEACVAVSMVSLTPSRSIFITSTTQRAHGDGAKRSWYSSTVATMRKRRNQKNQEEREQGLPAIPSATLTEMRTWIQGASLRAQQNSVNVMATIASRSMDSDKFDGGQGHQEVGKIRVHYELRHDVHQVSSGEENVDRENRRDVV